MDKKIKLLSQKEITDLAKRVALFDKRNNAGGITTFSDQKVSYDAMHDVLREQFKLLAGDNMYTYEKNKLTIFQIITETIDAVLPKTVLPTIGRFAEVKTFKQGEKPEFKIKVGRGRGKGFISKAAQASNYNVFRLDTKTVEVPTVAYGGACQIQIEQFLDGTADFSELLQIVMNEMENSVYRESRYAMEALSARMQVDNVNRVVAAGFNIDALSKLLQSVKSYGAGAQILASERFAANILTSGTSLQQYISDADKNDIRNQGYLGKILGADIILLPNAFEDETNKKMTFQDRYAYVLPTGPVNGATEQVVKVALEGQTLMRDFDNHGDWSKEMQVYKKMGVAIVTSTPHIGVYEDASIPYIERNRFGS